MEISRTDRKLAGDTKGTPQVKLFEALVPGSRTPAPNRLPLRAANGVGNLTPDGMVSPATVAQATSGLPHWVWPAAAAALAAVGIGFYGVRKLADSCYNYCSTREQAAISADPNGPVAKAYYRRLADAVTRQWPSGARAVVPGAVEPEQRHALVSRPQGEFIPMEEFVMERRVTTA